VSVVRRGSIDSVAGPAAVAVIATGFWPNPCSTVQPEYVSMKQVSTRPTAGRAVVLLAAAVATGESLLAWTTTGTVTSAPTARRAAGRARRRTAGEGDMRNLPVWLWRSPRKLAYGAVRYRTVIIRCQVGVLI
jgi:hypothetical protein